jgi:hypothetical protein
MIGNNNPIKEVMYLFAVRRVVEKVADEGSAESIEQDQMTVED